MSPSNAPIIHQSSGYSTRDTSPGNSSVYSYSSTATSSTGSYREYGAGDNNTSYVTPSGGNIVIQHNKSGYDYSAPSPGYGGAYSSTSTKYP